MENKTIEEQISELSQEQQNKILKIGKVATIIGGIIIALMIFWAAFGCYLIINPPLNMNIDIMKIGLGIIGGGVIGFACIILMIVIIKAKYPFYSDAKLKYIKSLRKGK